MTHDDDFCEARARVRSTWELTRQPLATLVTTFSPADTDLLPLFLYFWFGSSQYLQGALRKSSNLLIHMLAASMPNTVDVRSPRPPPLAVGAVAVVSLLVNNTVTRIIVSKKDDPLYDLSTNTIGPDGFNGLTRTTIQLSLLLACFTGIFQFGIGILRLGNVMNLMSRPVISGFQSGAAVTIGAPDRAISLGAALSDCCSF